MWREALERKGMRVNVGKTKVMESRRGVGEVVETGKWPCGVCGKGVGANSVLCSGCGKWVHGACSGVKGALKRVEGLFRCGRCAGTVKDVRRERNVEVGEGQELEKVGKFCYLGDVLSEQGGVGEAVRTRVKCAWKKWRELAPLLLMKTAPMRLKGSVYSACVRRAMLYGSETWAVTRSEVRILERAEMRMLRWIAGVSLKERRTNEWVRGVLGVEPIGDVLRRGRMRWFGHVERMEENSGVRRAGQVVVDGKRPRGRPKKTWESVVKEDLKQLGLKRGDALDRVKWSSVLAKPRPTSASQGTRP